jgi:hypothetical protein
MPRKGCGVIHSRCRRGNGGSGNRVGGKAYFLALARLESACVALRGTRIVGPKSRRFTRTEFLIPDKPNLIQASYPVLAQARDEP